MLSSGTRADATSWAIWCCCIPTVIDSYTVRHRLFQLRKGLQRLELYAGKLARTVLRGGTVSNGRFLPDSQPTRRYKKPRLQ